MLKPGVVVQKTKIREVNKFSIVHHYETENGKVAAFLAFPLEGSNCWKIEDLRAVTPSKVWNKAYRKGLCAGKNLKKRKNKNVD